jgi:hypothetical protein
MLYGNAFKNLSGIPKNRYTEELDAANATLSKQVEILTSTSGVSA